ncbi:MAG: GntR family transcriptional regulator [Bacilli bacterium]|nr:GntR family transcriptional regulator [Bacilli bacterium]
MKITLTGKGNVYEQLVSEYKRFIELNIIRYDEKLPSCRMLALELGINPNTVQKAYTVLENEGYIHVIPKKGVYVSYKVEDNNTLKKKEIFEFLNQMKENNVEYQMIKDILDDVYGGENND